MLDHNSLLEKTTKTQLTMFCSAVFVLSLFPFFLNFQTILELEVKQEMCGQRHTLTISIEFWKRCINHTIKHSTTFSLLVQFSSGFTSFFAALCKAIFDGLGKSKEKEKYNISSHTVTHSDMWLYTFWEGDLDRGVLCGRTLSYHGKNLGNSFCLALLLSEGSKKLLDKCVS